MLALFLTWKTTCTFCCYWARFFLEGQILDGRFFNFKQIPRLGLDLCYIAFIFLGFNIAQTEPCSRFNCYVNSLIEKYPFEKRICPIAIFLVVCFIMWLLALFLYRKFKSENAMTKCALAKKSFFLVCTYVIGILLFVIAAQTQ